MEYPTYLIHYGTLGQKWGVRKYQNEDGTWTEEGLRRRRKENFKELRRKGYAGVKDKFIEGLSDNYKKKFDKQAGDYIKRDESQVHRLFRYDPDYSQLNNKDVMKKKVVELGVDDEIKNFIGKYSNSKIRDIIIDDESARLRKLSIEKAEKEQEEWSEKVWNESKERTDKADILESTEKIWWIKEEDADKFFKDNKRISDATDIAIKALGKDGLEKYSAYAEYITKDGKPSKYSFLVNSFNYPDYTPASGMVQIADLANRGYTKEQIKELIKDAQALTSNCDSKLTIKESSTLDALGAYSGPIRYAFVDKCCELAKENTLSDAKQSRIKSLLASGKSQAEVAKMLGVSTSTVNKYK